jgi:hypothetical protein
MDRSALLLLALGVSAFAHLYPVSAEIIPASRRTDWGYAGVRGGIPTDWPVAGSVTDPPYSAVGDGLADDTGAIQAWINAAPAESVLLFPPGTYRTTKPLTCRKALIFRGVKPDKDVRPSISRIVNDGSTDIFIIGASSAFKPVSVPLVSGFVKGSTTVRASSVSGFSVGDYVLIDQLNDTTGIYTGFEVTKYGVGTATWVSREDGNRAVGQYCLVTAISADTITFTPPLNATYHSALSPQISRQLYQSSNVGFERLYIEDRGNSASGRHTLNLNNVRNFWVTDCEFNKSLNGFIYVNRSLFGDIHGNWIHDGIQHLQNRSYGVEIGTQSAAILVYDNVMGPNVRSPFHAQWGASGCVYAYNYCNPEKINDASPGTTIPDYSGNHGAHPMMNLFEGNYGNAFRSDFLFGSSSHYTLFRNYFYGNSPSFTNGTACVDLQRAQTFYNVVGNVLGGGRNSTYYFQASWLDGLVASFSKAYIRTLGYYNNGLGGPGSTAPKDTLIWHGNYDSVNKTTLWDPSNSDHTLPASLYLSAKPPWWGSLPWPAIGPDVEGRVNEIPAQVRAKSYIRPGAPQNVRIQP